MTNYETCERYVGGPLCALLLFFFFSPFFFIYRSKVKKSNRLAMSVSVLSELHGLESVPVACDFPVQT